MGRKTAAVAELLTGHNSTHFVPERLLEDSPSRRGP